VSIVVRDLYFPACSYPAATNVIPIIHLFLLLSHTAETNTIQSFHHAITTSLNLSLTELSLPQAERLRFNKEITAVDKAAHVNSVAYSAAIVQLKMADNEGATVI